MKVSRADWTVLRPQNAVEGGLNDLQNSGIGGFQFSTGDVVEFPTEDEVSVCITTMKNGSKAVNIGVMLNGKARYLPFGCFRRRPAEWAEDLEDFPVNLQILQLQDDLQRLRFLAGKVLKVESMEKMDFPVFVDGQPSYKNGKIQTTEKSVAIFTLKG